MKRFALAVPFALALAGCQMPSKDSLSGEKGEAKPTAIPASTAPSPASGPATERARKTDAAGPARPASGTATAPPARPLAAARRIAQGTALPLVLETTASSDKSQAGDAIVGKLAADLKDADRVLVPAGAEVRGEVLAAQGSGRVKGRARLAVRFMKLVVEERPTTSRLRRST